MIKEEDAQQCFENICDVLIDNNINLGDIKLKVVSYDFNGALGKYDASDRTITLSNVVLELRHTIMFRQVRRMEQQMMKSLRQRYGVPGKVEDAGNNVYRVQLGGYATRAEAQAVEPLTENWLTSVAVSCQFW